MKLLQFRDRHVILILFTLFLFISIFRINFPDLDHGDEFADANVLNAGENFIRFGFIKSKFLPVFKPNLNSPVGQAYTHYPPLPEIINGLLRTVFHADSLYFFRAVSLFCSFLNLLFWYFFVKLFTKNPLVALMSAVFYLSNPLFIFGIDSLHEACFSEILRSLIFFVLIVITESQRRKKILFLLLWSLVFLESLITFEYIIYLCIFFALFKLMFNTGFGNKLKWRDVVMLGLAPLTGFLLHFLQNAWYFGSYQLAAQDLTKSAFRRIIYDSSLAVNFDLWLRGVILQNISLTFLCNDIKLLLLAFIVCVLYLKLQKGIAEKDTKLITSLAKLLCIFIICGMSWYVFFPLHSYEHGNIFFLARHLLPAAAIAFTIYLYIMYTFISASKWNGILKRFLSIILILIGVIFIIKGIKESNLPVTPRKIELRRSFLMFKENLLYIKRISNNTDIIGTTIFRSPNISYYTNRQCQFIQNKKELAILPQLPRYFILHIYKDESDEQKDQLKAFLNQRYDLIINLSNPLWEGLSFLFFELKE